MKRHIPLQGTFNIRDLGGYAAGESETLWRRCLRGDSLHRLDKNKADVLIKEGVTTVVDLRAPGEVQMRPNPFSTNTSVCYQHMPLFLDAVGADQSRPFSLEEIYIRALTEQREQFAKVMLLIAEAQNGGVLFHCTTGKDRTGLIAALLLSNAGVDDQAICDDYALTGPLIAPLQKEFLSHAAYFELSELAKHPMLECNPKTIMGVLNYISGTYGSTSRYLIEAGLPWEANEVLRKRLLGPT
ncbi:tyrosine-protein phosphatase [Brucella intermedia]|uniref:tyrosine-protein phosphatase n=1 Tax=Brucella TaxID=234 RepID=UPI00094656AF|nr:tyrosine-protein phosphatase [Brucella intermedia]